MNANRQRGVAWLPVLGAIVVVGFVVAVVKPPPAGSGSVWWAPQTWGAHKPADQVDAAKAAETHAAADLQAKRDQVVHQAAIEADKTVKAAGRLPEGQAATVVQRTAGNAFSLLNQVSPLTATEQQDNTALILGLLATEIAKREAAEAAQAGAEKGLRTASDELRQLQTEHAVTTTRLAAAQSALREAFEDRNAKANELAIEHERRNLALWAVAILAGLALYLKMSLGSFGAVLHRAEGILPADKFKALLSDADGELSALAKSVVRSGRLAAQRAEDKARHFLTGSTATPPTT